MLAFVQKEGGFVIDLSFQNQGEPTRRQANLLKIANLRF